jgi:hypothetical protein
MGSGVSSRWARIARGCVAALISTFLAALSHVVVDGGGPGVGGLALAAAFAVLVCITLAGKTLSTRRLALAVIMSQLMFHALFSVGASISPPTTLSNMDGMSSIQGMADGPTALNDLSAVAWPLGWMFLAHVLAVVATIAVLRRGEETFWALSSWALIRIRAVTRSGLSSHPVLLDGTRSSPAIIESRPSFVADLAPFGKSIRRRGPPATLVCS